MSDGPTQQEAPIQPGIQADFSSRSISPLPETLEIPPFSHYSEEIIQEEGIKFSIRNILTGKVDTHFHGIATYTRLTQVCNY